MSRPMYFDKDGQPMELLEWAKRLEDLEYKRVAETTLPDGKYVSTVWLGLDHGHGGAPIIFETMVFARAGRGSRDLDEERYATVAEALSGHDEMVAKWTTKH